MLHIYVLRCNTTVPNCTLMPRPSNCADSHSVCFIVARQRASCHDVLLRCSVLSHCNDCCLPTTSTWPPAGTRTTLISYMSESLSSTSYTFYFWCTTKILFHIINSFYAASNRSERSSHVCMYVSTWLYLVKLVIFL